ncbi:MAG: hypothetical protein NWT08_09740 [Akkermansiaceae bacterium]|nr:hypothetical protein [Akkermansiaceae bacterium]MDP4722407.1 hypothetical protein [Akkermansiaceae bacterium]MDP4848132.1 hypothetical protein [Akkermansiaceae bacterium]MDP4995190.1 hypothetical protein [Akkermansiaceae bacterium]
MKYHRYLLFGLATGLSAFAVTSCAYDPYYSSSYGGYGNGYGYGNSSFTTSYFVSTGSSRWGYDPYAGCYYDYTRRAYYDPYLSGYYPVGYRPRYVSGAPHPNGWSRGSGYCPPPSSVRSYNLTNYQDRTSRYRNLGRDWSRNVRSEPSRDQRPQFDNRDQRPSPFGGFQGGSGDRKNGRDDGRREGNGFQGRDNGGRDYSRDRGNTTVTIPDQRPQGFIGGGAPEMPAAPQEMIRELHQGGESRGGGNRPNFDNGGGGGQPSLENRGGGGGRPNFENRGEGGGRPNPENRGGGSDRDGGGEPIRGIGEG